MHSVQKSRLTNILHFIQVEELIADLPSLTIFDEFALKACGFYCQASCRQGRGFPSVILNQWKLCTSIPSVQVVLPPSVNIAIDPPSGINDTQIVTNQTVSPPDVNGTQFVMVRNELNLKHARHKNKTISVSFCDNRSRSRPLKQ